MRVAFDARALGEPALAERGIGRYVASLLEALHRASVELVVLERLGRPWAPARVRELWEHALLARDVRAARADVVHQPTIDFVSARPGAPLVVTVHDLAPLKHPERYLRSGLKHRARYAAVRRAAGVIVPSRAVAVDCERLLGLGADRIHVVAEAAAPVFHPRPREPDPVPRLRLPSRFLLWVGGLDPPDPRKGVGALARAVAEADGLPLVLAGRIGPEAAELAVPGRVHLAGRVDDDQLAQLYSRAEAFVFTSDDEGFGLPPVEALACGTPVAAYDTAAVAEAVGGAEGVRLVPVGDVGALLAAAAGLAGTTAHPPERTWDDVARETVAVYEAGRAST